MNKIRELSKIIDIEDPDYEAYHVVKDYLLKGLKLKVEYNESNNIKSNGSKFIKVNLNQLNYIIHIHRNDGLSFLRNNFLNKIILFCSEKINLRLFDKITGKVFYNKVIFVNEFFNDIEIDLFKFNNMLNSNHLYVEIKLLEESKDRIDSEKLYINCFGLEYAKQMFNQKINYLNEKLKFILENDDKRLDNSISKYEAIAYQRSKLWGYNCRDIDDYLKMQPIKFNLMHSTNVNHFEKIMGYFLAIDYTNEMLLNIKENKEYTDQIYLLINKLLEDNT